MRPSLSALVVGVPQRGLTFFLSSRSRRGRLGYACLNTILRKQKPPVFCSRTCRIDTILKEDKGMPYLKELARQNVLDLVKLIEWNAEQCVLV